MKNFENKALETKYLTILRLSWGGVLLLIALGPTFLIVGALELTWLFGIIYYCAIWLLLVFVMLIYTRYWFAVYHYSLSEIGLKIYKGLFWQQQQMVPRNRVQHIDITTGPLERRYQLSKLIIHTAGTRNATVTLPGLLHQNAVDLRQELLNSNLTEDTV